MRLRAVIFDFDHTLVNIGDFVEWEKARERVRDFYEGAGVDGALLLEAGGVFGMMDRFGWKEQTSRILEGYELTAIKDSFPMPGALEALRWVKGEGLGSGVASLNSRRAVNEGLAKHGMAGYIDAVVSRDDVEKGKPHPEHLEACLSALKCHKEEAVMVGDWVNDVKAARGAGIPCIAVAQGASTREELEKEGADIIVDGMDEVMATIGRLLKA